MLRKYLARLLAFALVLNLVLCAPLSVGAEGENPEGATTVETLPEYDTLTESETGNVVVSDTAETTATTATEGCTADDIPQQAVSVEVPEPVGDITNEQTVNQVTDNGVTVDESFDLNADITAVAKEGDQITDIEYDIALDAQGTVTSEPTDSVEPTVIYDIDRNWQEVSETQPEFKVNMSIKGMNDQEVTRVEHKYKETENGDEKVEYYYNPNTKTNSDADNGKKFFTVVQETVENVTSSFVSLVTNFLGKFHITTDAFEGAADDKGEKATYSDLASAVNNAKTGSTVEMLRDYSTDTFAGISSSDNVTVDLNGKTYNSSNAGIWMQTGSANASDQALTIKNGTFKTEGSAITTYTDDTHKNTVTLDDVNLTSNGRGLQVAGTNNTVNVNRSTITVKDDDAYGVITFAGNNKINITDSTIDVSGKESIGIFDQNSNNAYVIQNSTINCSGGPWGIYHNGSNGGANISVIGSYIYADGATGQGIYISGNSSLAKNTLTIKDSTIVGDSGVEVKFTDVTIDNSTLIGLGTPGSYTPDGSGSTTVGAALAVTDNVGNGITGGTIIINSGNFKSAKDFDSIYQVITENTGDNNATIQLNGGRFVNVKGLYNLTDSTHAVISHNDGSEYPYEVVAAGTTPTRAGYKFLGFKDDQGKAITLEQAIAKKAIAYAQWELIPTEVDETPVKPATAPAEKPVIIVEPDSKGNNVDVTIKGGTAEVTVSTPAGEAAAVSEVTIPSVAALQEQGVKTVKVQVEENVTLELGVAKDDDTVADTIKITREDDILVITSGEQSEIAIHMTALKAAAAKPVSIKLDNGVLTIDLGNGAYKLNVGDALAASKSLSVKLEDGVLKLYDKDGNLIQEIKI